MKGVTLTIVALSAILYWPHIYEKNGFVYPGDDFSYVAHTTALVFFQWPDYSQEYWQIGNHIPSHSMGPALLAAPFAFAGSLLDRALGKPIVHTRSPDTLYMSWTVYGFIISSSVYLWAACLLLYAAARFRYNARTSGLAVICMVILQGIPLYAWRRPVFSHIGELFLQSALVYLLVVMRCRPRPDWRSLRWGFIAGLLSGLLFLVRPNDAPFALLWPLILFSDLSTWRRPRFVWKPAAAAGLTIVLLLVLFRLLPNLANAAEAVGYQRYEANAQRLITLVHTPSYYSQRLAYLVAGSDWGLIWTAPFLLVGVAKLALRPMPLRREWVLLNAIGLVNLWIVLQWPSQASYYGYRYLLCATAPILLFPVAEFITCLRARTGRASGIILAGIAAFPLVSMLSFSITPDFGLSLKTHLNGWANPDFQFKAWGFLLTQPAEYVASVLHKGVGYIFGAGRLVIGSSLQVLGIDVLAPRPMNLYVFLRSIPIWVLPVLLHLAAWRLGILRRLLPAEEETKCQSRNASIPS